MERPFSYTLVSNPVPHGEDGLYVLFSGESQTRPGHRLGPRVYDYYLMHHVLSGTGAFVCAGERHELRAGHSFLIAPEQLVGYSASDEDPWRYRWFAFEGAMAGGLAASASFAADAPVIDTGDNRRVPVLFRSIERALRAGGGFATMRAAGYAQLLFAEFGAAAQQPEDHGPRFGGDADALVRRLIRYLSTQYAEPVSIERMAESLGYNRAYLSRLFKRHTGMTPVTFLLKLRLDKARQLLRERRELTIEQIASSVGLQDPLYFSKQFRRFYGIAPSAYRQEMRHV